MIDSERSWLEWRALTVERLDQMADLFLELQLSVGEELLEEVESWFCAPRAEAERTPTNSGEAGPDAKDAPKSSPLASSSEPTEVGMRSIDDIIADAGKSLEHSLREAFDAGRNHAASELKRRMAGLFEELAKADSSATTEHAQPTTHERRHSEHGRGLA
jgi:hypothetical protein